MTQTESSTNLYALLIGINFYFPNRLSDESSYENLDGAVNDIEDVEKFLLRQPQKPYKIYKLTATSAKRASLMDPPKPKEAEANLPTYANIIKSFDEITEHAKEGDLVYIHYSGHGGRAKSIYPKNIKSNGIDEALVPTDIGSKEDGQYIRDLELAVLLKRMVDKGLVVTVILDSCHSGGSTRGGKAKVRGLGKDVIDQTPRLRESLVNPSDDELAAIAPGWKNLRHATRGGTPVATMIPEAKGYVLLAACRPSELAYEDVFDGKESNGALTYWLLDTLSQPSPGITYKMIHDRINGKINTQFPTQNPMILGDGARVFLGDTYNSTPFAVNVKDVKLSEKKVLLGAGQAQGLLDGSEFTIYPRGTTNFADKTQRLALAKIIDREATESWAEIIQTISSKQKIETDSQAVLTSVSVDLIKKVRLLKDKDTPSVRDQALQAIETAIQDNGWVKLVAEDANNPEAADYQVDVKVVNEEEAKTYKLNVDDIIYEICDRTGEPIILRPVIKVKDSGSAAKIVKRLVHLAKYQVTQELDNYDFESELQGKIKVELLGKKASYKRGDRINPEPFTDPENPTLNVGEYLFIKIHNNSSSVLNFTVLDLESNWAISQIEPNPQRTAAYYTPLDSGENKLIVLQMSLPEGDKTGSDIFKVFATLGQANFRWLELSPLDEPFLSKAARGITATRSSELNPLEQLLASLAEENPPQELTRTGNPVAFPSDEWTTASIKIRVENP